MCHTLALPSPLSLYLKHRNDKHTKGIKSYNVDCNRNGRNRRKESEAKVAITAST